jgi:hypothetical protein
MKMVEIDLNEFLNIKDELARKIYIENKLKSAGIDIHKPVNAVCDIPTMKYIYTQE